MRSTKRFLARINEDIESIDGVLITHDHRDHIRSVEIFSRRFGLNIHATRKTLSAASHIIRPIQNERLRYFESGDRFEIGELRVQSVPIPHDAADTVGYVIEGGEKRLGIFTDLGEICTGLSDIASSLDVMMLEANYDETMLETSHYPLFLKRRIRGPYGHLSNADAATFLRDYPSARLGTVILSHRSEENNSPDVTIDTIRQVLNGSSMADLEFITANRGHPTAMISV
jgi:phosphoribosyl 1,2-cyclic phosphodiesterase